MVARSTTHTWEGHSLSVAEAGRHVNITISNECSLKFCGGTFTVSIVSHLIIDPSLSAELV